MGVRLRDNPNSLLHETVEQLGLVEVATETISFVEIVLVLAQERREVDDPVTELEEVEEFDAVVAVGR